MAADEVVRAVAPIAVVSMVVERAAAMPASEVVPTVLAVESMDLAGDEGGGGRGGADGGGGDGGRSGGVGGGGVQRAESPAKRRFRPSGTP